MRRPVWEANHCCEGSDLASWLLFIFNTEFHGSSRAKLVCHVSLFLSESAVLSFCLCFCENQQSLRGKEWHSVLFPWLLSKFPVSFCFCFLISKNPCHNFTSSVLQLSVMSAIAYQKSSLHIEFIVERMRWEHLPPESFLSFPLYDCGRGNRSSRKTTEWRWASLSPFSALFPISFFVYKTSFLYNLPICWDCISDSPEGSRSPWEYMPFSIRFQNSQYVLSVNQAQPLTCHFAGSLILLAFRWWIQMFLNCPSLSVLACCSAYLFMLLPFISCSHLIGGLVKEKLPTEELSEYLNQLLFQPVLQSLRWRLKLCVVPDIYSKSISEKAERKPINKWREKKVGEERGLCLICSSMTSEHNLCQMV